MRTRKFCNGCKDLRDIDDFAWANKTRTKRKSRCKKCRSDVDQTNERKTRRREKQHEYRLRKRQELIKFLGEKYPSAKDFCDDIIKTVQELDGLPYGVLKEIADLSMKDLGATFTKLKELVPQKYLESIFETAGRANDTGKLIVLSEELVTV